MKCAMVELTEEEYKALQPLLTRSNRNFKNFCQSLVLNAIRVGVNGMFDIDALGKINSAKK